MEFIKSNGEIVNENTTAEVLSKIDFKNFTTEFSALSIFEKRKAIQEFELIVALTRKWFKQELKFFLTGILLVIIFWLNYDYCVSINNEPLSVVTLVLASVFSLFFLNTVRLLVVRFLEYRNVMIKKRFMDTIISE